MGVEDRACALRRSRNYPENLGLGAGASIVGSDEHPPPAQATAHGGYSSISS